MIQMTYVLKKIKLKAIWLLYKNTVESEGYSEIVQKTLNNNCFYHFFLGQTSESEIAELEHHTEMPEASEKSSTRFTCGSHFYEEVEDKKDSIWLVQVISADGYSVFSDAAWKELTSKIRKFDVRTGVFDCSLDRR